MKAKVYIGAKKYAVYIGRKIVEKTMNFFSFPARFFAKKDGALKDYKMYGRTVQSNLPDGYTQLEYIESTTSQYINTGIKGELESELTFIGQRTGDNPNQSYGHLWGDLSNSARSISFNTPKAASASASSRFGDKAVSSNTSPIKVIPLNTPVTIIENKDGATASTGFEITFNTTTAFETDNPIFLFTAALTSGPTASAHKWRCEYFSHKKNGVLVQEFIPCKNAQGEIGMYDTVSGNFFASNSSTSFVAGPEVQPTPASPIAIESVGDRTKNLFDKDNIIEGYRLRNAINYEYNKGNDFVPDEGYYVSSLVEVEVGKTYIKNSPKADTFHRYHAYNADKVCVRYIETNTITINDGEKYIALCGVLTELNTTQLEEGETTTSYEQYGYKVPVNVNGTTTNIYLDEPLRKLGEYADYIDFANQKVVRQVGELIFNGSEAWSYYNISSGDNLFRTFASSKFANGTKYDLGVICNKYTTVEQSARTNNTMTGIDRNVDLINNNFSDVNSWKAELTRSNVTVVYPLATPTEESITLPAIALQQGNLSMDVETKIKPSQLTITGDIDDVR